MLLQSAGVGEQDMRAARYEIKMICDEMYLPDVRAWVNVHPESFIEAYRPRRVNTLYFDTHVADCLADNLMGASTRGKLRFRWYGDDHSHAQGVLELKRKSGQLGWKETLPIPVVFDLTDICWSDFVRQLRGEVDGLFAIWLSSNDRPTLINTYMREYYESMDHQVRLTIDYALAVYEQIMHSTPNLVLQPPASSQLVVEVKTAPSLYRRLSRLLSLFPLQVGRNSKYVNGMMRSLYFT